MNLKDIGENLEFTKQMGPLKTCLLGLCLFAVFLVAAVIDGVGGSVGNRIVDPGLKSPDSPAHADTVRSTTALKPTVDSTLEDQFLRQLQEVESEFRLPPNRPKLVFGTSGTEPDEWASWSEDTQTYYVGRTRLDVAGMPLHVALMSRFLAHKRRPASTNDSRALPFYDDLRYSAVACAIDGAGFADFPLNRDSRCRIRHSFDELQQTSGSSNAVAELAIRLLEHYESSWSYETLGSEARRTNDRYRLFPAAAVEAAFQYPVLATAEEASD